MEQKIKISKLDAAKRQTETAIKLYFNNADPVSIHTLICSAHNILLDLTKEYKKTPMLLSGYIVKKEYQDEFIRELRKPQNHFKHADKDPETVIDFNPIINETFIIDCCDQYYLITNEAVLYFNIFSKWFAAHHLEYFEHLSDEQRKGLLLILNTFGDNKIEYFSKMLSLSGNLIM